jgi:hypothetical protein
MSEYMGKCITKSPLPDCKIDQLTTAELVASQITSSVMAVIAKNKAAQDLDIELKTTASAEGKGIGDMLGDILGGLFGGLFGGMGRYAMIASVCCCVCCCCLILLMVGGGMMAGGGKGSANAPAGGNMNANAAAAAAAQNAMRRGGT